MKATAIIQVRLKSSRLPGKALLPLGRKSVIYHVIERTKQIKNIENVIVAAGLGDDNSPLLDISKELNVDFYEGSENNVLDRFYKASLLHDSDYYIRVTGDNPLTDFHSASDALTYAVNKKADHCYVSGIPIGTGIEIISRSALKTAYEKSTENNQLEHVTPYIKENPDQFIMEKFEVKDYDNYDCRLTVDTDKDYEVMSLIYNELYTGTPISLSSAISFLKKNPEIRLINNDIEQRPMSHSSIND